MRDRGTFIKVGIRAFDLFLCSHGYEGSWVWSTWQLLNLGLGRTRRQMDMIYVGIEKRHFSVKDRSYALWKRVIPVHRTFTRRMFELHSFRVLQMAKILLSQEEQTCPRMTR